MKHMLTKRYRTFILLCVSIVFLASVPGVAFAQEGPRVPIDNDLYTKNSVGFTAKASRLTAENTTAQSQKEYILDGIVFALINMVIDQVGNSIVNWINNGFDGGPGFVTNPGQFFKDIGNELTGKIIQDLGLGFLCGDLDIAFKINLNLNRANDSLGKYECTIEDVLANFSSGVVDDLDIFYRGTVRTGNNPYTTVLDLNTDISIRIAGEEFLNEQELGWGNGFLSSKSINGFIQTPGAVVEKQLNKALDSGQERIQVADEISEIIGAVLNLALSTAFEGLANTGSFSSSYKSNGYQDTSPYQGSDLDLSVFCDPSFNDPNRSDDQYDQCIKDATGSAGSLPPNPLALCEINTPGYEECISNYYNDKTTGKIDPDGVYAEAEASQSTTPVNTSTKIALYDAETYSPCFYRDEVYRGPENAVNGYGGSWFDTDGCGSGYSNNSFSLTLPREENLDTIIVQALGNKDTWRFPVNTQFWLDGVLVTTVSQAEYDQKLASKKIELNGVLGQELVVRAPSRLTIGLVTMYRVLPPPPPPTPTEQIPPLSQP